MPTTDLKMPTRAHYQERGALKGILVRILYTLIYNKAPNKILSLPRGYYSCGKSLI
jgi:hypothetical protein